jgi:hypothetical protein
VFATDDLMLASLREAEHLRAGKARNKYAYKKGRFPATLNGALRAADFMNNDVHLLSRSRAKEARPTFIDSAASGFTLAARLRGRAVAATNAPRRERHATDLTPSRYCSAKAARLPGRQTAA